MKWSFKIGRMAGIDIRMHLTFLLLLAWVAVVEYRATRTAEAVIIAVLFTLSVFFTVVLHELGHALAARRYGVGTREIVLLPIGGVSRLERMPEDPRRELWISLAGPVVSLVIAAILYAVLRFTQVLGNEWTPDPTVLRFVWRLMWVNLAIAIFNLVPAFPMDGGRVLRAALAMKMPYARATHHAARLGQGLALLLGVIGLFSSPFLVFIALFVWMGATGEGAEAQIRGGLEGIPVRAAMVTDYQTLSPGEPLSRAAELVLAGAQEDFPVLEDGVLQGVLTRDGLLRALADRGSLLPVSSAMDRTFETADPSEMLSDVLPRLQACECHTVPVLRDGKLIGLLTPENIGDFLAIQSATEKAASTRAQAPRPRPA